MKNKKNILGFGSLALAVTVMGTSAFVGLRSVSATDTQLTEDEAKQIALDRAKVDEADVTEWIRSRLDSWDGDKDQEWDLAFLTEDYRYEVEVNALTGDLEDFEKSRTGSFLDNVFMHSDQSDITEDEAKEIALDMAEVTEEDVVEWTRVRMDEHEWEIRFNTDTYRYEMDISARSGDVKDYEEREIPVSTGQEINEESAKDIALNHARLHVDLDDSDVDFVKSKADRDDGRDVFEVEFRSGWTEFDYTIDAATGDILEWDIDYDD